MADHYHPSNYDRARRGSSPGRPWDRNPLPPSRPAVPPRSFSNMDPQRANYAQGTTDPRKRNASRSPDGLPQRKQQRQDAPRENGTASSNPSESRRSSVPTGTTAGQATNPNPQSPYYRRPSAPATNTMRKPSDPPNGSSPRSPRESANSGRSTPQQKSSSLSTKTSAQQPNGAPSSNTDPSMDSKFLADLLVKFSSEVARRAALEYEKDQAQARLSSARREFNEMEKHFKSYPAIEERHLADKEAARKALNAKEKLLKEHQSSPDSTIGVLASLLGQLAAAQTNADVVSRSEYDSLQKNYLDLKQEITSLKQLRNDLTEVNRKAEVAVSQTAPLAAIQRDVDLIKNENAKLVNWQQGADTRMQNIDKFDQRLTTIATRSTNTQKALDDFKDKDVSKLAAKQKVVDLETNHDLLSQKIAGLQKAQAKATQDAINAHATIKSQAVESEPKASSQELLKIQNQITDQVAKLEAKSEEAVKSVDSKIDATIKNNEATSEAINKLREDIVDYKERVHNIQDSIEEEGKDIIVKRVKKLDFLVNNLSSKIEGDDKTPITQRVSQLEKDSQTLQEQLRSVKSIQQPLLAPDKSLDGLATNLWPIETRLSKLEGELESLNKQQDEKDRLVGAYVDENVAGLEKSLREVLSKEASEQLRDARRVDTLATQDMIQKITEGCLELHQTVNGLKEAMASKAATETIETLKTDVSAMSEEVKKLKTHHHRAKSTSQTPGHHSIAPQPQQMPNGMVGSPHLNGPQQPHSPYAQQHNRGSGPPHQHQTTTQSQEMQEMQMQVNSLVAVTQQLKMRCDNLQTDDVVRAMVDQFGAMYPDARNFDNAVKSLRNSFNSLQQQVASLQKKQTPPTELLGEDVKKAVARAEGASQTAHNAFQKTQEAWQEINTLREAIRVLENEVKKVDAAGNPKSNSPPKTAINDSRINDEMQSLRDELDKTAKTANDADALSKQHASRFSKIQPEGLKNRVAALETTVDEHTQKLQEGESALKHLRHSSTQGKSEAEQIRKNVGVLSGKIAKLEQDIED